MRGTDDTARTPAAAPRRIALLAAGLLILAALTPRSGTAQQPGREIIADVAIVGNQSVPAAKAMNYILFMRPGAEYSPQRAQDDVSRLAAAHLFKHITVRTQPTTDGRVIVIFQVREHRSIVREVVYKHAKHVSDDELEKLTKIRKGMPLDVTLNKIGQFAIQDHLKQKGRYFASVTLEEGFDESHDRVVYNITEGPVVRVRKVDFTGQGELASAERLRTQVDTSRAFAQTFGGVFQPQMVDNDVLKLEEYYRANGYLNVHVSRDIVPSADFQFVDITFHVQEGPRYRVKDVNIQGTSSYPSDQLKTVLLAKSDEYYSDPVIAADMRNVTDFLGWRGHQSMVQKTVTTIPGEPGVVNVQYLVEEKQPTTVGRVIIIGNTVTKDEVIRRSLGILPGQTLRFPELRLAENQLTKLGIFETDPQKGSRPTVTPIPVEGNSVFQDVLVQVNETHTGSFMVGAGVNSDNGLVGSIVLNERNFDITRWPTSWNDVLEGRAFRGGGQEFRIEAVPGSQLQRYTVSFREPYLFNQPYSLSTSAYYYDRVFNEYTESRTGGRLTLSKQLSKAWAINVGLRLEDVQVSGVVDFAPADYLNAVGHSTIVGPSVGLAYDTTNSYLRPTAGERVTASYEQVMGNYMFPIFNFQATKYFTVTQRPDGSGKQVFLMRNQTGVEGSNAPVFERFFAGGFQSIRGYQFRGVGPNENGFMLGGSFMFLNSLEYQIPILASDNLYGVAFVDSGTVEKNVSIRDYRVTAGVGLRVTVPALGPVPIALDFGFPLNHVPGDREQVFAFWFGLYR